MPPFTMLVNGKHTTLMGEVMKSLAIGILLALGFASASYACGEVGCTTTIKGNIDVFSGSMARAYGEKTNTEALSLHEGSITAKKTLGKKEDGTGYDVTVGTSGFAHSKGHDFSGTTTLGTGGFHITLPKTHYPYLH